MSFGSRTVCMPDQGAKLFHTNTPTWTKIFERVPGATIEGTAPANTTVQAAVEMKNHKTGETFVYRQQTTTDANGNFEMTVPYSTTGYDEWGTEEGYTNVSVRANSTYQLTAIGSEGGQRIPYSGSVDVTEGQVIGENESASNVTLEPLFDLDQSSGDGSETNSTDTGANETSGTDTTETTNTTDALAPIDGARVQTTP